MEVHFICIAKKQYNMFFDSKIHKVLQMFSFHFYLKTTIATQLFRILPISNLKNNVENILCYN